MDLNKNKSRFKKYFDPIIASLIGFTTGVILVYCVTGHILQPVDAMIDYIAPNNKLGERLRSEVYKSDSVEYSIDQPDGEYDITVKVKEDE